VKNEFLSLWSKTPLCQQHQTEYLALLDAVKGNFKEKRLAIQFITKFNKHFPELIEKTIESQFDLCEAEESMVKAKTHTVLIIYTTFLIHVY
jgi:hypothetical protein